MSEEKSGKENLVVVSKLKSYIKASAGLSTSGSVPEVLSEQIRQLCDGAIESAKKDGRKTVMDRDFQSASASTSESAACSM